MRWPRKKINSRKRGKVFLDTLDAIQEFKRVTAVEAIHEGLAAAKARGVKLIKRSDIRS